jgi:glycosyltransferase involved in cell wall biosynthesis
LTKKINPLVSVIVPYYNSKEYVYSAINSIFDQTYRSIEIIIIDDCSEEPFEPPDSKSEIKIKIIRNKKNLGAGRSRIKGINVATGRFISFLDSDDIWFSDKVSIQIEFMLKNSRCMCWSGYIYADNDLNYLSSYMPNHFSDYFSFITKFFTIGCLTCIYDRKYLNDPKNANLKLRNDYQMWLHLFTQIKNNPNLKASPINFFTAIHRTHERSLTKSKIKSAYYWWLYLLTSHHSIIFKSFCFLCYFIFTIKLRYFDKGNFNHSSKMQSRISFRK